MPKNKEVLYEDIQELIEAYHKLSFWQKWLFPRKLKQAITSSAPTNFNIYKSFVNSVWFFQRWLIGCLSRFANSLLMRACKESELLEFLTEENAINQANFITVLKQNESYRAYGAVRLLERLKKDTDLLTCDARQANFNLVVGHTDTVSLDIALLTLIHFGLLYSDTGQRVFNAVAGKAAPVDFARFLIWLYFKNLFFNDEGQDNLDAVAGHANFSTLALALRNLNEDTCLLRGDLGQANFNAVIRHADPLYLASALESLKHTYLLRCESEQANFNAIIRHADPKNLASALGNLKNTCLLRGAPGQVNFNAIIKHADPKNLAQALCYINVEDLLTGDLGQANFNAVIGHPHPESIARALVSINHARLLRGHSRQAIFTALIKHTPILFGSDRVRALWTSIPPITGVQFAAIIAICKQHVYSQYAGMIAFEHYVNQVIIPNRAKGGEVDGVGLLAERNNTQTNPGIAFFPTEARGPVMSEPITEPMSFTCCC
jgi:hypothetical protein